MKPIPALAGLAATLGAILMLGCAGVVPAPQAPQTPPADQTRGEADIAHEYNALQDSGGRVYTLDPAKSTVRIYAYRGGRASRLGHNHVLAAPKFSGYAFLPADGRLEGARFDLEFRLDELALDEAQVRARSGDAFSATLTDAQIALTREHMLGEDNLQAQRYPTVRVRSLQITGEAPRLAARIRIELHGAAQDLWLPLEVGGLPDALRASGSFVIRQTDFGIKPYSILGGLVAVQDPIVIEFNLASR